jgi:hypothetical protein
LTVRRVDPVLTRAVGANCRRRVRFLGKQAIRGWAVKERIPANLVVVTHVVTRPLEFSGSAGSRDSFEW